MTPTITAFDWVPKFAEGQVRDLRVRWALEEAGQGYDVRYLYQGEQKEPAHRALQPFGQVPTYQDDTVTLFESGAIVLHIAARFGGGLLPEDHAARARAVEWVFAALNTVEPPMMDYSTVTIFERDEPWSAMRRRAVEQRVAGRLGDLSRRLADGAWLDGDLFTAGDLLMVTVLRIVEGSGLVERHENLAAYVARGTARPAFRKALADQIAGFTGTPPPQFARPEQQQGETA